MKNLSKIIDRLLLFRNATLMIYDGSIDYPGVSVIRDVDVYRLICNHSRLIDRLSPQRMTEMTLLAQCILMRIFPEIDPNDPGWTFYGKHSLYNKGLA